MDTQSTVGVITGDLVDSSRLTRDQKAAMMARLSDFLDNNPDVLLPIRFFRGDSFQLMVTKEKAAYIAVIIEAIVLSTAETWARLSIGIGSASGISPDNVLLSDGEAFQLSGHQMDKMKGESRLLKIALNNRLYQPILSSAFYLVESIILNWKPGQAAVIAQIPFFKTQKEIAEKLNIAEPAVSKAIKTSNWPPIENFLIGYEETIKEI